MRASERVAACQHALVQQLHNAQQVVVCLTGPRARLLQRLLPLDIDVVRGPPPSRSPAARLSPQLYVFDLEFEYVCREVDSHSHLLVSLLLQALFCLYKKKTLGNSFEGSEIADLI